MKERRIEVVTYDLATGVSVPDHVWTTAQHHGKRKARKLARRVERWLRRAAAYDKSTDHVLYIREI